MPFSAGGGVDAIARLLAEKLRDTLKQNIVVENKPGASGMLGAQYVAKAAPDGYTLLLGSAGETAINLCLQGPHAVLAREGPGAGDAGDASAQRAGGGAVPAGVQRGRAGRARAQAGALTYATSGVGNPQHLNGELLQSLAGITMVHVPYKGASGQLADVASGNVDMTFVSYAGAAPFIQGGRVKALAVTSATRASFARDIPAIAETPGLSAYALENWFGLYAPARTPAVVQRVYEAVRDALADPALAQRLREQGGEPAPLPPAEFAAFIASESKQYAAIVERADITADK